MKLPWEITAIYSEVLKQAGHQSDDEEDEDDIEAHEASIQRLKEADEATREMTREEYQHYSECRQASFTYRKSTPELYSLIIRPILTVLFLSKTLPRIPQPPASS